MKKVINFNFKNMAEFCEQTNPVDLQLTLEKVLKTQKPVVGLSLSLVIRDILDGKLPLERVVGIISSTRAKNEKEFQELLSDYCNTYWMNNPEYAKKIAMELYKNGRIFQPRLFNNNFSTLIPGGKKYLPPDMLTTWGPQVGLDKIMKGDGKGPNPYEKMLEVLNSPTTPTKQK